MCWCCRKPYRKGLTPYYFAAEQPGLTGNEQFFYFTSLVSGQWQCKHGSGIAEAEARAQRPRAVCAITVWWHKLCMHIAIVPAAVFPSLGQA
jgi:hypothetical protein